MKLTLFTIFRLKTLVQTLLYVSGVLTMKLTIYYYKESYQLLDGSEDQK
jgi:hypothetical protein